MNLEHNCNRYKPVTVELSPKPLKLRIAVYGSSRLKLSLGFDCSVLDVPEFVEDFLTETPNIDFLLIQTSLRDSNSFWTPYGDYSRNIIRMCEVFSRVGVPIVLWHTESLPYVDLFREALKHVTLVAAISEEICEAYSDLGMEVMLAPLAIQPALHHSLHKNIRPRGVELSEHANYLHPAWSDFLEFPELLKKITGPLSSDLSIVETFYTFMSNKLLDLPSINSKVLGSLGYLEFVEALRSHPILWLPQPSLMTSAKRTQIALEGIACGQLVLLEGSVVFPDFDFLEPVLINADDASQEDSQKLMSAIGFDGSRVSSTDTCLVKRRLMEEHTYRVRLEAIAEALKTGYVKEPSPKISIVTPTKRLQLLDECIQRFSKQTYPNKELILVINSVSIEAQEKAKQILDRNDPDVRVYLLEAQENIGTCLNLGIANMNGEYWFKMDDDDHYGPNYVKDLLSLMRATGSDIAGKPPVFTYLEGTDEIIARKLSIREHVYDPKGGVGLCGATLAGTRRANELLPFAEDRRANVDSDFVQRASKSGLRCIVGDRFNFVIHRADDKSQHTWRMSDKDLRQDSRRLASANITDFFV